jgi:phosphate transport system protein
MTLFMQREVTRLRKLVLAEGALVEQAIEKSMRAFHERNAAMADEVINADNEIDQIEIDVEEECLKILALHTPVAADLRFVVAVLKLNNDLERMGDIAVSIARRARFVSQRPAVHVPEELRTMDEIARRMVKQSLDALINGDKALAREICKSDDIVDNMKRDLKNQMREDMEKPGADLALYIKLLDIPRHLERIADLATNIAEDVIYMSTGEISRHNR